MTVEARVWQEVEHGLCGFDGSEGVSPKLLLAYAESGNPSAKGVVGMSKRGYFRYLSNSPSSEARAQFDYDDSYNRNYNTYNRVNDKDLVLGLPERASNSVEQMKLYYGKAPNSRGEGGDGSGPSLNREGDYGNWMHAGCYETALKLQNYNAANGYPTSGKQERMDQPPYQTQPNCEIIAPRNRNYGATVADPLVVVVHDYPPPRPEIKCFDEDPLNYWSFMKSFDMHIAHRMSSDSVKLVYLLQHCTPKVRSNLEHWVIDWLQKVFLTTTTNPIL